MSNHPMAYLARIYLKAKGLELPEGSVYDANKIAKGLSKLYREANKNRIIAGERILLGAEYFDQRGLDWTPEAVWRRWEDIEKWLKDGKPKNKKEIKTLNPLMYE